METRSDVATDAKPLKAVEFIDSLATQCLVRLAKSESQVVAAAVLHDAVGGASKAHTAKILANTELIGAEVLAAYLRSPSNYPAIVEAVMRSTGPAARETALLTIRNWTKERAITEAEGRACAVLQEQYLTGADEIKKQLTLLITVASGTLPETLSAEDEQRLRAEADKLAAATVVTLYTPETRRTVQKAASLAVEEVARQVSPEQAMTQALAAARAVAARTAKAQLTTFLTAEVQRRASRETRDRLKLEENKPKQEYYEEAMQIARDVLETTLEDIVVLGSDLEVDHKRLLELSTGAATAAARDICEPFQQPEENSPSTAPSNAVKVVVVCQVIVGALLIWIFLLGGAAQLQPLAKSILPPSMYSAMYGAEPEPDKAGELDSLLEGGSTSPNEAGAATGAEPTPAGTAPDAGVEERPSDSAPSPATTDLPGTPSTAAPVEPDTESGSAPGTTEPATTSSAKP